MHANFGKILFATGAVQIDDFFWGKKEAKMWGIAHLKACWCSKAINISNL